MEGSTTRFSGRVENYVRYRPAYPQALIDSLMANCTLDQLSTIADIDSGTGIFSREFLDKNCQYWQSNQIHKCEKPQNLYSPAIVNSPVWLEPPKIPHSLIHPSISLQSRKFFTGELAFEYASHLYVGPLKA